MRNGDPKLALVYVAKFRGRDDLLAEFVDAKDPVVSKDKKWVIIVSTQFGCPVACPICDAGGDYLGDLRPDEILAQINHVVFNNPPSRMKSVEKFKVQFARMGEPALNPAVLDVLRTLPDRFRTRGLIPCIATIAPLPAAGWFRELLTIRRKVYAKRPFQLQFSINSTDEAVRDRLMPAPKMSLGEIADYTRRFPVDGRKIGLNFALAQGVPVDAGVIAKFFDPSRCCIKITPLNPTTRSAQAGLETALCPESPLDAEGLCSQFKRLGFDVIVSIGDTRENAIGSNCGMAVKSVRRCLSA